MAIPDYQSYMLPFLQCLKDGGEKQHKEIRAELVQLFSLTSEEEKELLPSGGKQAVFINRVG